MTPAGSSQRSCTEEVYERVSDRLLKLCDRQQLKKRFQRSRGTFFVLKCDDILLFGRVTQVESQQLIKYITKSLEFVIEGDYLH